MSEEQKERTVAEVTRRQILGWSALVGASALAGRVPLAGAEAAAPGTPFELEEATIGELQRGMAEGRFTATGLVLAYLARIDALDQRGPAINQVLELNPDALAIAQQLDAERRDRGARGPLHGIPVLLKDNIDTGDRMMTTAGSFALAGPSAPKDAFLAARLRAAGAVVLGKTNLSEWANFRSTRSSSGWSGRGGQGRNPYALSHNTSGSSSGSAASVAASLCTVAVGTETDGSIVSPSSINGIVGIKPTVGLVSRAGVVPISHSQDTAGPMARTVTDAAILLGAMTGVDPEDPATRDSAGRAAKDYTRFLDAKGLAGARLGIVRADSFRLSLEVKGLLDDAVRLLQAGGATIVDPVEIATLDKFDDSEFTVLLYEFKADLAAYLARRPDAPIHRLADAIAFNEAHADEELVYFGQELMTRAEKKGPLTDKEYLEALANDREMAREKGIDAALGKEKLDALVMITNGPAWPIDLVNGDHYTGGSSSLAAVAGYPSITVPVGFVRGLPIGLSFTGTAWSEPTLVKLAFAFEQMSKARRAPTFAPGPEVPASAFRRQV